MCCVTTTKLVCSLLYKPPPLFHHTSQMLRMFSGKNMSGLIMYSNQILHEIATSILSYQVQRGWKMSIYVGPLASTAVHNHFAGFQGFFVQMVLERGFNKTFSGDRFHFQHTRNVMPVYHDSPCPK